MLKKPENITALNTKQLAQDVSIIIDNKHQDLLRVTNTALFTLFWEIGTLLNKLNTEDYYLKTISEKLTLLYGSFFTESSMGSMRIFANKFSDPTHINSIALFVTWEHILLYLRIENEQARLYYIKRTIEDGLSLTDLDKEITNNVYERINDIKKRSFVSEKNKGRNKSNHDEYLKIGLKQLVENKSILKSYFEMPLLNFYRSLVEPSKNSSTFSPHNKTNSSFEDVFFLLSQKIEIFRQNQNSWLNLHLNLSFLEIGSHINQVVKTYAENYSIDSVLQGVAKELRKIFEKSINKRQLHEMFNFANTTNQTIKYSVASQLCWSHILKLLTLTKSKEWVYYAQLAIVEGLSPNQLQQKILDKVYKQRVVIENNHKKLLQNSRKNNTTIEKKNGSVTVLNTVYIPRYEFNNSKLSLNIFKNPYFYLLNSEKKKMNSSHE